MPDFYIPGLYELVWFVGGAFIYSSLARALRLVKIGKYMEAVVVRSLILMASVIDDMNFIMEIKYKTLEEAKLGTDTVKIAQELDRKMIDSWQEESIRKIKKEFPIVFDMKILNFENWEEAMKFLVSFSKKEK